MGPQLENGYTKIADAILENIAKSKLNGTQFRILMIVWRSTYGWGKKSYSLSVSYLAEATGINKQQIKRELSAMIDDGVLIEVKAPSFNTTREIQFNKNYANSTEVAKKIPGIKKGTKPGSELDTPPGSELGTQNKELNKHNKKQEIYCSVFNCYLESDLVKHKTLTNDMKKAIDKATKELGLDEQYMKRIITRHKDKVESTKKSSYPVKQRTLSELFGQKKHNSTSLICTDYLDEVWKDLKPKENKVIEIKYEERNEG